MKDKIGVFYGSTTCYTEMAAEKICAQINILTKTDCTRLHDISDTSVLKMADYRYLIAGIPTWDFGELQEDWEDQWETLREINLESKYVALFGLGDQVGYPEWFQDAMGYLWQKLKDQGAIMVGTWPNQGYSFTYSKALNAEQSMFLGLPLDDENQFDQTDSKIQVWTKKILTEFGILNFE